MSISRKSQVWYTDFIVGLLIFIISVVIYFHFSQSTDEESEVVLNDLITEVKALSNNLIGQGFPSNWTNETVSKMGLTDNNYRINLTKLEQFNNMSSSERRNALGTTRNYYFYLQGPSGSRFNEIGSLSNSSSKVAQATRVVIYNSSIVRMVVVLWV